MLIHDFLLGDRIGIEQPLDDFAPLYGFGNYIRDIICGNALL